MNIGNLIVTEDAEVDGLLNGRNVSNDGTKLDTVATNADVTGSTSMGTGIHGVSSKGTPGDIDELGIVDGADSNSLKKLTWGNLKATLKTYFDTLYLAGSELTTHINDTTVHGIEAGAEVNNISDANATDLTDGGETTLHSHAGGGGLSTRKVLFNAVTSYTGSFGTSLGCSLDAGSDEKVNYVGMLPDDFVSIASITVLWAASSTGSGNWVLSLTSQYGAVGESYSNHETGDTSNVVAVPASGQYVNRSTTMSTILSSASANDIIGFWLFRDANHGSDTYTADIIVRGVLVTYNSSC